MKTQYCMNIVAALALAAGAVALAVAGENNEDKDTVLSLSQVPAAVQTTIQANVATSDITRIKKEDKAGKPAYEVESVKSDLLVAEDGKLLSKEVKMTSADVPEAVRKTLAEQAGNGKVEKIEQVTEDGKAVYEAEFEKGDKGFEVTVAPDGKLIKSEEMKLEEGEHKGQNGKEEDKD